MQPDKKSLCIAMLLITVGTGWLLGALGIAPRIDWIWTLGLAVVGLLTIPIGGFDKITVVVAPFFILASGFSIMRQTDRLSFDIEVPLLVLFAGVLLLIARLPAVPAPRWMLADAHRPGK